MKNIHLIPSFKPSRLFKDDFGKYFISINIDQEQKHFKPQNIYITSNEPIKGDWHLKNDKMVTKSHIIDDTCKKIILTTDQDLINDGVQPIDDEFLKWFVKNPNCDEVFITDDYEQVNQENPITRGSTNVIHKYKIIIPKEEPKPIHEQIIDAVGGEDRFREISGLKPKQQTLEEVAERLYGLADKYSKNRIGFIEGAKSDAARDYWFAIFQQEQDNNKYSGRSSKNTIS
jgi:hypothetical protein